MTNGYDFVGDSYNGNSDPVPDDDPMDCNGHGSHLAGTIAAQKNNLGFTGAATGVTLSSYRVFGCFGSTSDEILLDAFTQAYEDGADIINLSLGAPGGWSSHPWSVVVSRIVDAGVSCIVAAGNEGEAGVFFASTPADAKGIAAIGATENTKTPVFMSLSSYTQGDHEERFLYRVSYRTPEQASLPLWALSLNTTVTADGCEPFPDDTPDLSEYLLLLRQGGCTYEDKAENALAKGAKAIVEYSEGPGIPDEPTDLVWNITTHAVVEATTGETWVKLLQEETEVVVRFPGPNKQVSSLVEEVNTVAGGAVAEFSTWGPTWEMDVKPQFSAPGGSILSTYPLGRGGYAIMSGTSMATPLTAAIHALLGEARGTLDPQLLKNLLSSTASPQLFHDGTKFHPFLAPVPQQGAGSVQVYDAAYASTLLEPSSLSFNDTDYFSESLNFTLTNEAGQDAITYQISNIPSRTILTLDESGVPGLFPNQMVEDAATLEFSTSKVTLKKGESATIAVLPTPPQVDASRLGLWSGWVAINGTDGSSLILPYQGLTGSLYNTTVLDTEAGAFVTKFTVPDYEPLPENSTFNLPPKGTEDLSQDGDNVPLLITNYNLGTRLVRAELVPVSSQNGTEIGQHSQFPMLWMPRGRAIIDWGGRLDTQDYAPPGAYRFRVKALRLRGDEDNEDDWDVSLTQVFSITYQTNSTMA